MISSVSKFVYRNFSHELQFSSSMHVVGYNIVTCRFYARMLMPFHATGGFMINLPVFIRSNELSFNISNNVCCSIAFSIYGAGSVLTFMTYT